MYCVYRFHWTLHSNAIDPIHRAVVAPNQIKKEKRIDG